MSPTTAASARPLAPIAGLVCLLAAHGACLDLMFRSPELYGTGMAVSPVTDWRLYDTIYTERLMGLPDQNIAGYRDASVLPLADRLRGNLLLVHGTGDDNVHFQNSEVLINALVAADKPFTMMAYPNRSHCICEGLNTTRHIYGLLTKYFMDKVPAGAGDPRPGTAGR